MTPHKEIRDQIENLIKTSQTSEPLTLTIPNFTTQDLYPLVFNQFNADAVRVLANKTHSLVHQYNKPVGNPLYSDFAMPFGTFLCKLGIKSGAEFFNNGYVRHAALVNYFGYRTTKEKVGEAALEMVKVINDLCANKYAIAALEPLFTIEVADGSYFVVSYLAIDNQYEPLVKTTYSHCIFPEGGVPPEFK